MSSVVSNLNSIETLYDTLNTRYDNFLNTSFLSLSGAVSILDSTLSPNKRNFSSSINATENTYINLATIYAGWYCYVNITGIVAGCYIDVYIENSPIYNDYTTPTIKGSYKNGNMTTIISQCDFGYFELYNNCAIIYLQIKANNSVTFDIDVLSYKCSVSNAILTYTDFAPENLRYSSILSLLIPDIETRYNTFFNTSFLSLSNVVSNLNLSFSTVDSRISANTKYFNSTDITKYIDSSLDTSLDVYIGLACFYQYSDNVIKIEGHISLCYVNIIIPLIAPTDRVVIAYPTGTYICTTKTIEQIIESCDIVIYRNDYNEHATVYLLIKAGHSVQYDFEISGPVYDMNNSPKINVIHENNIILYSSVLSSLDKYFYPHISPNKINFNSSINATVDTYINLASIYRSWYCSVNITGFLNGCYINIDIEQYPNTNDDFNIIIKGSYKNGDISNIISQCDFGIIGGYIYGTIYLHIKANNSVTFDIDTITYKGNVNNIYSTYTDFAPLESIYSSLLSFIIPDIETRYNKLNTSFLSLSGVATNLDMIDAFVTTQQKLSDFSTSLLSLSGTVNTLDKRILRDTNNFNSTEIIKYIDSSLDTSSDILIGLAYNNQDTIIKIEGYISNVYVNIIIQIIIINYYETNVSVTGTYKCNCHTSIQQLIDLCDIGVYRNSDNNSSVVYLLIKAGHSIEYDFEISGSFTFDMNSSPKINALPSFNEIICKSVFSVIVKNKCNR